MRNLKSVFSVRSSQSFPKSSNTTWKQVGLSFGLGLGLWFGARVGALESRLGTGMEFGLIRIMNRVKIAVAFLLNPKGAHGIAGLEAVGYDRDEEGQEK